MPTMTQTAQRFYPPQMAQIRANPRWQQTPQVRASPQAAAAFQMAQAPYRQAARPNSQHAAAVAAAVAARAAIPRQAMATAQPQQQQMSNLIAARPVAPVAIPQSALAAASARPSYKYTATMRNPPTAAAGNANTQSAVHIHGQEPLTTSMLAAAMPQEQKQMLGERLFPLIREIYPDLAGKITGMLLEIDNSDLLHMLEDRSSLKGKVNEAVAVLQAHQEKLAMVPKKDEV